MIWAKTDAGRAEMQARALTKERAQRNLLLVIDGIKTEEMLLANLAGIAPEDFAALQLLGLIEQVVAPTRSQAGSVRGAASARTVPTVSAAPPAPPRDYAEFTEVLTRIVSKELGLRGFTLTLAIEKAGTAEDLHAVAQRALTQIAERKGEPAANTARRALYGE